YNIDKLAIGCCIVEQKKGAEKIPTILKNWVESNVGTTPEEREQFMKGIELPPIFILCTFWNQILVYDYRTDSPNPKDKISKMLDTRFFDDLFSDFSWRKNWTTSKRYFKNIYLLRDYEYCTLYSPANVTPEPENGFNQEDEKKIDYYNGARDSFVLFRKEVKQKEATLTLDINDYFEDPKVSFEAASLPNLDGSLHIIECLRKLDASSLKMRKLANILNKNYHAAMRELKDLHIDDSMESRIEEAQKKAKEIHNSLTFQQIGSLHSLAYLQEKIMLDRDQVRERIYRLLNDDQIFNNFEQERYKIIVEQYPNLTQLENKEEKLAYLFSELDVSSVEEIEKRHDIKVDELLEFSKMESTAQKLIDKIFAFWQGNIEFLLDSSFNKKYPLRVIIDTLVKNFKILHIRDAIADSIGEYVNVIHINPLTYSKISDIITSMFNNHLMTAGWYFSSDKDKEKQITLAKNNDFKCREDVWNNEVIVKDTAYINSIFDGIERYEESNGNGSLKANPMMYNTYKWRDHLKLSLLTGLDIVDYDEDSNKSLKKLLNENNELEISIG
ncbi:MAG: virulence factor SrfC family protein, partial [Bacteroidota bacterium]